MVAPDRRGWGAYITVIVGYPTEDEAIGVIDGLATTPQ